MHLNLYISVILLAITPLVAVPLWYFVQNKSSHYFRAISLVSIGTIWSAVLLHFMHDTEESVIENAHFSLHLGGVICGILFTLLLHFYHRGNKELDGISIVSADYIHNIVNSFSLIMGIVAFPEMWLPITFSLVLHELVHKAGNFGLLISIGLTPKKALLLILLGIPTFLIIPFLHSFIPIKGAFIPFLSNFASANLLLMSLISLMGIHKRKSLKWMDILLVLAGVIPAFIINFIGHAH